MNQSADNSDTARLDWVLDNIDPFEIAHGLLIGMWETEEERRSLIRSAIDAAMDEERR